MKRSLLFAFLTLLAAAVAACGGGGSAGPALLPRAGGQTSQKASATIRIVVPSPSGVTAKRPAYIAPGTASFGLSVYTVDGATPNPQPTPLTFTITNATYCTTSAGATTCTAQLTVPVAAAVVVEISSYDAGGALLGQGFVGPIDTTQATIPAQSVALGGVVSQAIVSPSTLTAPDDGSTHTVTFTVSAKDAQGDALIQPAAYAQPIVITPSGDPNGSVSLSPSVLASPGSGTSGGNTVTLTYNSAHPITGTISLQFSSGGASVGSVPFAPTANGSGSLTVPVVSIEEYALPSPPAYSTHVLGAIASEPSSNMLVMADTADDQIIAVQPSQCSIASQSCTGIGAQDTPLAGPGAPVSIALDPLGDIITADPGTNGGAFAGTGDVQLLNACSPFGVNCTATVQTGLTGMSSGPSPIVTPAPRDAIAGSDGYLYVTIDDPTYPGIAVEPLANRGIFTYTSGGSVPNQLAVGTDRAVWFTDAMAAQVGRVTCVGLPCTIQTFTNFDPGTATEPYMGGLVAGSDGYMYALETAANEIARFRASSCSASTSTCTITQIPIPTAGANAQYIALGPDGNIWFTETNADKIGVVVAASCATVCRVHEYAVPTANKEPWGITAGPDGNLWFTEHTSAMSGGNNIGDLGEVVLQ